MPNHIILSGCSGGGKSTLLEALAARGHTTVAEPGRRIVRAELARGGTALPWLDVAAFAHACIDLALADLAAVAHHVGPVFFDRALHDNAIGLASLGLPVPASAQVKPYSRVILLPPWPEIRTTDPERRHDMGQALAEYDALTVGYPALGYPVTIMPKATLADRITWLSQTLHLAL